MKSALPTAINQSFDDYEVVVCDNNSSDDTRDVVEMFMPQFPRMRYVNPKRDLSMCDNWDFALTHARGRFIIYLSDDDGLLPDCLSHAHQLISEFDIKLLVWPYAYYNHPDIPISRVAGMLSCDFMTGKLFEVTSDSVIKGLCEFQQVDRIIPRMLNCVIDKSLVEQATRVAGRFFVPPFPDYSTACQMLGSTECYHFVDFPLYIVGASVRSNTGLRFSRKEKNREFVSLFEEDLLAGCPYPMRYLTTPYLLKTYLGFGALYPEQFRHPIDMNAYFESMLKELTIYEDYEDVTEEYQQLAKYMNEYYGTDETFDAWWKRHAEAKEDSRRKSNSRLELLRKNVRNHKLLYRLSKKVKDYVTPPRPTYLEFTSVASMHEAALLLQQNLPRLVQSPTELQPERTSTFLFLNELRAAQEVSS